jgi:hypothetical protein
MLAQPTTAEEDLTSAFLSASALSELGETGPIGVLSESGWSAEPGVSSQHVGVSIVAP